MSVAVSPERTSFLRESRASTINYRTLRYLAANLGETLRGAQTTAASHQSCGAARERLRATRVVIAGAVTLSAVVCQSSSAPADGMKGGSDIRK
jgi:hypothetical protein